MKFRIGEIEHKIDLKNLNRRSLIVVKELFLDEYARYTPPLLEIAKTTQTPCIAVDYPELHQYSMHLNTENNFYNGFDTVFQHGLNGKIFPKLRFGLKE